MTGIKTIAVIGATGRLGAPVTAALAKNFRVRAVVRSIDKAKKLLPANVELVQGDLRDIESLRAALAGIDAIYLNLSTETIELNQDFYEEREGVRNIIAACEDLPIQYIAKIGALGAYPPALKNISKNMIPNIIRMEGHDIIKRSGIPHTFFAPTHFMELLPNMIAGSVIRWIGNTDVKIYWISVEDYASLVVKAFEHPEIAPENCPVQGLEPISVKDALRQFVKHYDRRLKIRVVPVWIMRIIGLFDKRIKFVAHLFAYFGNHEDPFYAHETWQKFGKPSITLDHFSRNFKLRQANH